MYVALNVRQDLHINQKLTYSYHNLSTHIKSHFNDGNSRIVFIQQYVYTYCLVRALHNESHYYYRYYIFFCAIEQLAKI